MIIWNCELAFGYRAVAPGASSGDTTRLGKEDIYSALFKSSNLDKLKVIVFYNFYDGLSILPLPASMVLLSALVAVLCSLLSSFYLYFVLLIALRIYDTVL